jgi:hypothetical protein
MRICAKLALLCFLLGISLTVSWAQTNEPSKTPVASILNNPPDDNPQYFPKGIFGNTSDKGAFKDFVARWYSSDLRAMHEPSLFEISSKDTSLVAYRFLWLRTFDNPVAIRISIRPDGTASLTGKITNGAGGYNPGVVTWDKSFELSASQVSMFLELLKKAEFWTLPTEVSSFGVDGAQWIMEGVRNGTYHVVDRFSPQKDDYTNLCFYLVNLSKIELKAKEIY